jgi:hypothetical protein
VHCRAPITTRRGTRCAARFARGCRSDGPFGRAVASVQSIIRVTRASSVALGTAALMTSEGR